MNQFFEFSKPQMRTITILAVFVILAGSYKFIRDYYINPATPAHEWEVEQLDSYRPILIVDINLSPADSLELVPGIGPVLTRNIIDYRNQKGYFSSVDSLINVPGIGLAKLREVRAFMKVSINE